MTNNATKDLDKTGFDLWYEKEYNNAQKEAMTFRRADMRKAYEAAYRVAFGLIEKGIEHAWKEGYVVGFTEAKEKGTSDAIARQFVDNHLLQSNPNGFKPEKKDEKEMEMGGDKI